MKRFTIILLFLLASSITFAGLLDFGIKLGYNANKLSTKLDSISSQIKSGFSLGIYLRIGKRLHFQPELYYTLQGAQYISNTKGWDQKITIGSMDVPLLLGFKFLKSESFNVRIMAGPVMSFVVNKSVKDAGGVTGPITSASIKSINWYVQMGAGVDFWKLNLDIRYQLPLNQMIQSVETWNFDSKNNVFVVSLGFRIL